MTVTARIRSVVLLLALAPALAGAQTAIPGLFNTGVNASRVKLAPGATDPHYTAGGSPAVVTDQLLGTYVQDPNSAWIWLTNNGQEIGQFTFRTTFTLGAGLDPLTALITGRWATDNVGVSMLLNGVATGNTNTAQFGSFTPFSISSGFVTGVNTLDFTVENFGGPAALNVTDLQGTVRSLQQGPTTTIPEPATVVLLGTGFAVLGAVGARRRRNA